MNHNPYEPPASEVGATVMPGPARTDRIPLLISGRRWLVVGFLVMVFSAVARTAATGPGQPLIAFGGVVAAITGIIKISKGLTYPTGLRVALSLAFLVPFLNILVAFYLLARTATTLKQLGASRTPN
jgi:hypothetical protein